MNLSAFLTVALLSVGTGELFYGKIIQFSDGDLWRIQAQTEISQACDSACGASCLSSPPVLLSLLECLELCQCQGAALPVEENDPGRVEKTKDLETCEGTCEEICESEDADCKLRCKADFCVSEVGSSVWMAVALDVAMLGVLLAMLYLAYLHTPKKQKRVRYWRKKILEAQYARLEDY